MFNHKHLQVALTAKKLLLGRRIPRKYNPKHNFTNSANDICIKIFQALSIIP